MGLFEKMGRRVERFKQAAVDAAEEEATHRCADCGELFYTAHDACPECGGDVVALVPDDEAVPDDEGTDSASAGESQPDTDDGDQ